jgi:hypothetical protein
MLYPDLFKMLEKHRWNLQEDVPWDTFDRAKITPEQLQTIRMNAITE